jgi:hypothetical protein
VRPAQVSRLLLVVVAGWRQETASRPVTAADRLETEQKTVIRMRKRKKPWWDE